jgi:hypothetical protein
MAAFRRQNKADNAKNEAKRALEAPHATALLLRYCPTANRWSIKSFHMSNISVIQWFPQKVYEIILKSHHLIIFTPCLCVIHPTAPSCCSLRGADAAIVNQWASAPSVNRDRTDRLWTALSKGAPCAAALHAMRSSSANAGAGDASASASGSEQPPRNFEVFNAVCYGLPSVAIADK